jgi:hypothetical protein
MNFAVCNSKFSQQHICIFYIKLKLLMCVYTRL